MRGKRVKVMQVVPDLAIGGAERQVTTLLTRLDRSRFEPSVVCLGDEGALFSELQSAGVAARSLGTSKRQAPRALWSLYRLIRAERPDLVLTRGYSAEAIGRLAALAARVPRSVVWVHSCTEIGTRSHVRRVADRLLDRTTDAYFGVTESQVPYLVDELGYPPAKIVVLHNGVDLEAFDHARSSAAADSGTVRRRLGLAMDHVVIGIVAALRPEKDHETFLHAAALLADRVPEARFLVVGDGDLREGLEDLARRLGLSGRAVFTGARSDVQQLLQALDVFVLSSTTECAPMALLEAMAAALPAVCTEVGGVPDLVVPGVTGFLVPARDPAALAGRLEELAAEPELRRSLGRAARARVEQHFGLDASISATESALLRLAPPPARPLRLDVVLDEVGVGGVEVQMLALFRAFDPQVVTPRLICLRSAGAMAADFEKAGFAVTSLDRRGRNDFSTLPRLAGLMRRRGTDAVLVTHHHRAALALGRVAARAARVPVDLVAVHDMDLTSVGKRCLPVWAVRTLRFSSALVLLSRSQRDYLHREEGVGRSRWSRTREVVIPNGVSLSEPPTKARREAGRRLLGLPDDAFVVAVVARLTAQKAHHVLLAAFGRALEGRPDAHLVLVGDGPRLDELRGLAGRLGVGGKVHFVGQRRDVPDLLPAFDVVALSSVHEGMPVVVLEAMAAGLPVVATDCGSIRDVVIDGETGYVVPVGDDRALGERLVRLAEDPALRQRLGRAARGRAERDYGLEATARAYESLLVGLLQEER